MNRKHFLILALLISVTFTTVSFISAPDSVKNNFDFVISDLGVESSTASIFNLGVFLLGIITFISLNLKSKKDIFLVPIGIGLVMIAIFNKADFLILISLWISSPSYKSIAQIIGILFIAFYITYKFIKTNENNSS